jgi:hypothetical protein
MQDKNSPALLALWRLLDLMRGAVPVNQDMLLFGLRWLAAGKLVATGRVPSLCQVQELLDPTAWQALTGPGFADSVFGWSSHSNAWPTQPLAIQSQALGTVARLIEEHGTTAWGLQDAAWAVFGRDRGRPQGAPAYDPALCDLIVGALEAGPNAHAWVPFDPSGQFTVRLARRGARIWRAGPSLGYQSRAVAALLLALEDDPACSNGVCFDDKHSREPSELDVFTHCLVAAPMGMKMQHANTWQTWVRRAVTHRELQVGPHEVDRSDAWAVAAMWPAAMQRAVFLTSPNLLFAQGQEQRLRQALTVGSRRNQVAAAVALPPGLMSHATIAGSILVLDNAAEARSVRTVDLAGQSSEDGSTQRRFGRDISADHALKLLAPGADVPQLAVTVSVDECQAYDYSLVPARYTRRVTPLSGSELRRLEDLLQQVVRSPVPSKDFNAVPVWEIGIPLLDRWNPIEEGFEKWMPLSPKKAGDVLLRPSDIVLSIKGSLGKAGIVGDIDGRVEEGDRSEPNAKPTSTAAVVSPSCIALRVQPQHVLPEYLLLYLRSNHFKQQLEALRVGSAIAHITPSVLLSSVVVPVPSINEQAGLVERYWDLKRFEKQIKDTQEQMDAIQARLF